MKRKPLQGAIGARTAEQPSFLTAAAGRRLLRFPGVVARAAAVLYPPVGHPVLDSSGIGGAGVGSCLLSHAHVLGWRGRVFGQGFGRGLRDGRGCAVHWCWDFSQCISMDFLFNSLRTEVCWEGLFSFPRTVF